MIARSAQGKILVFVVFFVGIATGVLISNFYETRVATGTDATAAAPARVQRAQRDINKFYDYLGLDQKQREQFKKIGEETRSEFKKLREETQPKYEAIQQESRTQLRALMNAEQRQKYDDFRK